MTGKVLEIQDIITPDQLGTFIADRWATWNMDRREWLDRTEEVRQYIFATDTTKTTNSKLPWKNKTTLPKVCQIRDNLYSNYLASLFPKRKWLRWQPENEADAEIDKKEAIESYVSWTLDNKIFKQEIAKCILDWIDYGNCFASVEWIDQTHYVDDELGREQVGYVGPALRRISPLDIVFNPTATSFESSPKIIRSWVSLGDVKSMLEAETGDKELAVQLLDYLKGIRHSAQEYIGEIQDYNDYYRVDGFDSFTSYLSGDYVELLTFYGDYYDYEKEEFKKNHIVVVADRHKVILEKPSPSYFGYPPIFHAGWRIRQDNLWAMGPLDNLIGMQYRIDHIENLKADVFDLIAFPVLKIKGQVDDFEWGPFEKIYMGDEGDVEILAPPFQVLQANLEINQLEQRMEEMAGAPKEAMGFRTPGEKTMYEVQRLENAAGRIFNSKIVAFEESFIEPAINAKLEMGRRLMPPAQTIRIFDEQFKIDSFLNLTKDDLTGAGRIRPIAARHFAEKAEKVQNISNFFQSALGQDPEIKMHFSSVKLAEMFEDLFDLQNYDVVMPYIRLAEQQEAQKQSQAMQEQTSMEGLTADGLSQDDFEGEDLVAEQNFSPLG